MDQPLPFTDSNEPIVIETPTIRAQVAPWLGGSLLEFAFRHGDTWKDIFRRAPTNPRQATLKNIASFVMAPWVGRIPELKFTFEGQEFQLTHPAATQDGMNNGLHSIFRQLPFRVHRSGPTLATLAVDFESGMGGYTWMSNFHGEIGYSVSGSTLMVRISCKNTGDKPMLFAAGTHPMILKRGETPEVMHDSTMWLPPDPQLLVPAGGIEELPKDKLRPEFAPIDSAADYSLHAWSKAAIRWPREGLQLKLGRNDNRSNHMQVWAGKPDGDVFALEQQSAAANAPALWNLLGERSGAVVLRPGKTAELEHTFTVTTC